MLGFGSVKRGKAEQGYAKQRQRSAQLRPSPVERSNGLALSSNGIV